VDTHFV